MSCRVTKLCLLTLSWVLPVRSNAWCTSLQAGCCNKHVTAHEQRFDGQLTECLYSQPQTKLNLQRRALLSLWCLCLWLPRALRAAADNFCHQLAKLAVRGQHSARHEVEGAA